MSYISGPQGEPGARSRALTALPPPSLPVLPVRPALPSTTVAADRAAIPIWSHRPLRRSIAFPRVPRGRRGYHERAVDDFVDQVTGDLAAADAEIDDLRAEVDRLHRYIRRQWAAVAAAENRQLSAGELSAGSEVDSPAVQARAVLTQAQELADRRLAMADARLVLARAQSNAQAAQAERQARLRLADAGVRAGQLIAEGVDRAAQRLSRADAIAEQVLVAAQQDAQRRRAQARADAASLLGLARTRYEDVVVRAHQRADRAAEVALEEFHRPRPAAIGSVRERIDAELAELQMKTAYLSTFAKASRGALQAALDVTASEFDRLVGVCAAEEAALAPQKLTSRQRRPQQVTPQAGPGRAVPSDRAWSEHAGQSKPAAFNSR